MRCITGKAVGYYPGKIYNGGPLATKSTEIDSAGRSSARRFGRRWAAGPSPKGFEHAAFQNQIFYITNTGSGGTGTWANLTATQPSPHCFTDVTTNNSGTSGDILLLWRAGRHGLLT